MPEAPEEIRTRLVRHGLSERDVGVLMTVDIQKQVNFDGTSGQGIVAFFDELAKEHDPKAIINW
jgi:hypothetical protein